MVTYDSDSERYELEVDGHIAFASCSLEGRTIYINHVEAPVALRGTGAAGKLMQGMMEHIRQNNLKVVPVCSYAMAWIQRHAEYNDLLA